MPVHIPQYVQGVIQDFEVEGGNEKSNQTVLTKRSTVISIPSYGHSVIQLVLERGGGDIPPFPPLYDTLMSLRLFITYMYVTTIRLHFLSSGQWLLY